MPADRNVMSRAPVRRLAVKGTSIEKKAGVDRRPLHLLLLATLSLAAVSVPIHGSQAAGQGVTGKVSDYVGSDACSDCHFAEFQQFQKTAMSAILSDKYPLEQLGCEACHGPGRAHAEGEKAEKEGKKPGPNEPKAATLTYNFTRHSAKENAARCLTCHQKDEKQSLFKRSQHLGSAVACNDCHDLHRLNVGEDVAKPSATLESYFPVPKRPAEHDWLDDRLLREKQPQLCYSCHREVEAEFQLPVRHRVNEGSLKCTDCHNPHGSFTARELKSAGTDVCTTCHVEKKGPFAYEHAAVLVEGCTVCHTPHGFINLHLLKRRQERQLCLECHAAPQAVNVPHPRLGFQAAGECTRCHVEIHGSNYQPQFLR